MIGQPLPAMAFTNKVYVSANTLEHLGGAGAFVKIGSMIYTVEYVGDRTGL